MLAVRLCLVLVVVAATHTYARDLSHPNANSNTLQSSYGTYATYGSYGYYGYYATAIAPDPHQPDYFSPNAPPPSPPSPPPSPPLPRPPQFEVRLATLPGGDLLAGVVEVRPVGSATVWGAACAVVGNAPGDGYYNTLPRLVCRHLGLPWRRAHAVSLEPFAPPRSPMAGYLSPEPTGQGVGMDGWALGLQTFQQLWQSMHPDGEPFPRTFNTSECPGLAVRCTDDTPVPAVRLVAYGNMTGPGRGVLQVQLRPGTSEWLHTSYYRKDCPDGDDPFMDDYLFDADGDTMYFYFQPMTAAARVACRQLGLPYNGAQMAWVDATQGPLPGSSARTLLPQCNGNEEDLGYCLWNEQTVTMQLAYSGNGTDAEGCIITTQYAAVTCGEPPADAPNPEAIPPLPAAPPTRPPAPPGDAGVRLFNGSRDWGLAQVRVVVNGTQHWATVCATADYDEGRTSSWGLQAFALLTCRELARPTVGATKIRYWLRWIPQAIVSQGGLYVPRIDCKGNEPTVSACAWSGEVQACDRPEGCWCDGPIGVSCREDPTDSGSIVGYRLDGGGNADEGVVAAAVNHGYWEGLRWGLVCKDGFDDRAAQVVCRSLGKPYQQARAVDSVSRFPGVVANQDYGHLWDFLLDHVSCSGQEGKLDQCALETLSPLSDVTGPVSGCVRAWDAAAVVCA